MLNQNIAKRLENDSDWQAMQKHIVETMSLLDSHRDVDFTDEKKAAIECRARQLAREMLIEILEPLGNYTESTGDTRQQVAARTGMV